MLMRSLCTFRDPLVFSRPLELDDGKQQIQVIIKAVDRHPVSRDIMHVDFQEVEPTTRVVMRVPIVFVGAEQSPGVRNGGVVARQLSDIELRGEVAKIPEKLELDLSSMDARERIRLSQVKVPAGIDVMEILRKHDHDVVTMLARRGGGSMADEEAELEEIQQAQAAAAGEDVEAAEGEEAPAEAEAEKSEDTSEKSE